MICNATQEILSEDQTISVIIVMIFNIWKMWIMSSFRNCMRSSDITTSPVQWVVTGKNQRMIIIFSCRNVLIYHSVQDRQRTHRSVIKRLGWCQDLSLAHPSSTHPASRLAVRPWPPIGQFSLTSVTLGQSEATLGSPGVNQKASYTFGVHKFA